MAVDKKQTKKPEEQPKQKKKAGRKPREISTELQAEIIAALTSGQYTLRQLASKFGIPESTIRLRFSNVAARTISAANQMVSANRAINSLPIAAQGAAISLATKLQTMASVLGDAALDSAFVAAKAAAVAKKQAASLDESAEEPDIDRLTNIAGAARIAREAAGLPLQLLAMGMDKVRDIEPTMDSLPKAIEVTIIDASGPAVIEHDANA